MKNAAFITNILHLSVKLLVSVKAVFVTGLMCLLSLSAQASELSAQEAAALEKAKAFMNEAYGPFDETPGYAIAVVKDQKVLMEEYFGLADVEANIPLGPDTFFTLASVSKHFTALSLAMLENRGLISLDDPFHKYLPDFEPLNFSASIKDVLSHHAGIPSLDSMHGLTGWGDEQDVTENHLKLIERVMKLRGLDYEAGKTYSYSNTGYVVAAKIVEMMSGRDFSEWLESEIFIPAGMNQTFLNISHEKPHPKYATDYIYLPSKKKFRVSKQKDTPLMGASSIITNLKDFIKWAQNWDKVYSGSAQTAATIDDFNLIQETHVEGSDYNAALGLFKGTMNNSEIKYVEHGGIIGGFRTSFLRVPNQKMTVLILSNRSRVPRLEIIENLVNIFLEPEYSPEWVESIPNEESVSSIEHVEIKPKVVRGRYYNRELCLEVRVLKAQDKHIAAGTPAERFIHETLWKPFEGNDFYWELVPKSQSVLEGSWYKQFQFDIEPEFMGEKAQGFNYVSKRADNFYFNKGKMPKKLKQECTEWWNN